MGQGQLLLGNQTVATLFCRVVKYGILYLGPQGESVIWSMLNMLVEK